MNTKILIGTAIAVTAMVGSTILIVKHLKKKKSDTEVETPLKVGGIKPVYDANVDIPDTNPMSLSDLWIRKKVSPIGINQMYPDMSMVPEDPREELVQEEETTETVEEEAPVQTGEIADIRYVSLEDYENASENGWETDDLTYYQNDDILTDDMGEIVVDPDIVVGDCLRYFGEESGDPDVVYVQNNSMGTIFQVIRIHKSYQTVVLGYTTEDEHYAEKVTKRRRSEE